MAREKPIYERKLAESLEFTLREGSSLFSNGSLQNKLKTTLEKITRNLDKIGVPYLITGGFAVLLHGFRRFTEDIDILVTSQSLSKIHKKLIGLGYTQVFEGSRSIRDPETGVRIEFVVAGEFPGDGRPKPVAFPDPSSVSAEIAHMRVVNAATLIELKLASGMTGGYGRAHDMKDVHELIKLHNLDDSFAKKLNPYVQEKFLDIVKELRKRQLDSPPQRS